MLILESTRQYKSQHCIASMSGLGVPFNGSETYKEVIEIRCLVGGYVTNMEVTENCTKNIDIIPTPHVTH